MAEGPPTDRKGFATQGESLGEFMSTLVKAVTESVLQIQSTHSKNEICASPTAKQAAVAHDGSYILLDHTLTRFPDRAAGAVLMLFHASMRGEGVQPSELRSHGELRYLFKDHPWWGDKIVKEDDPSSGKPLIHLRVNGMHLNDWCASN